MKKLPVYFWDKVIDKALFVFVISFIAFMVGVAFFIEPILFVVFGGFAVIVGIIAAIQYWRLPND